MSFSTYYDSTDTGLAGVSQVAGSYVTFLDAVLVNGYNSKTLTSLTSVGTLVTATLTSHGYRDRQFVTISGATPSAYNGTWQIIPGTTSSSTFQFNVASAPGSSATGTLACIVASLGWSIAFTGTNLRAYQAPAGNRLFLRIDDTGTTSARVVGYETMTDVNTGVNPFPTTVQLSGGAFWPKASAAVARRMILNGNASNFNTHVDYSGDTSTGVFSAFGDGTSFKTGDAWATAMVGCGSINTALQEGSELTTTSITAMLGHFIARSYTQVAGAVTCNKIATSFMGAQPSGAYPMGGASMALPSPNPSDGNYWTSQLYLYEVAATTPRCSLPGVIVPLHSRPLTNYTIYQGAGGLSGREFMAINLAALSANGQVWLEVSNTF